jgi:hypothetical protein
MRLKAPRWVLFLEAMLLLSVVAVFAYRAATKVHPIPVEAVAQARRLPAPDPWAKLLEYYRQYPDRYIRVDNETWQYNINTLVAVHSFTLRNLATVPYTAIEVRFEYMSASGKTLLTRTVKIPGTLAAMGAIAVKKITIKDVPSATKSVVTTAAKATVSI